MKDYFTIQKIMSIRFLRMQGLHPMISVLLIATGFVALSLFFFYKLKFANYVYPFLSLVLFERLNKPNRNDFIKSLYSKTDFYRIKTFENVLMAIPFSLFLIYKMEWLFVGLPILLAIIHPWFGQNRFKNSKSLPTPYYRNPFEFLVGFRKTWFLYPIVLGLLIISITADNFNIGLFSLLVYHFITGAFYSRPENEFYIQIFSCASKQFLFKKIKTSLIYSLGLSIPMMACLLWFYPNEYLLILGFFIWGMMILITLVVSKYIAFPHSMTITQSLILMASLAIAPLLLLTFPYFYSQATKQLNNYL